MPSQLLEKLRKFFDQGLATPNANSTHPRDQVMALQTANRTVERLGPAPAHPAHPGEPGTNVNPHWVNSANWGSAMVQNTVAKLGTNLVSGVNTITIHETSGWPTYASAQNMVSEFLCLTDETVWVAAKAAVPAVPPPHPKPAQPAVPAHWTTNQGSRGIGPQYYVDANGTVFALIGDRDLSPEPLITWHAGAINNTSIGIENGDIGDARGIDPHNANYASYWFKLHTTTEAMPGLELFALLHPGNDADLVLIWFTTQQHGAAIPNFPGNGDTGNIAARYSHWNNMLFTERDYGSLALLCRLLTAQYGVPRNFGVLPYAMLANDATDSTVLRKLLLADERLEMMARKLGLTVQNIQNNEPAFSTVNAAGHSDAGKVADMWRAFFGFKRVWNADHSKASEFPELPTYRGIHSHVMVGSHPCPGPLFDWHRFAHEVWDWWWYPFDLRLDTSQAFPPRREYQRARLDTPLREFYYDAGGAGVDFTTVGARYNALGVAAEDNIFGINHFALATSTPAYAMANGIVVAARMPNPVDAMHPAFVLARHEVFRQADATTGSIDYDLAPSIVWTLTTHLACDQIDYVHHSTNNPDWLNRLLTRLTECELAVAYKQAHATQSANDKKYQKAWDHAPTSEGTRPTTGAGIQADATEYRRIVTDLQANKHVLFPLESTSDTTPVKIILGDFLGACGTLPNAATGVQVQIFSKDLLPITPVPTQSPIIWSLQDWWVAAAATTRLDGTATKSLPADGNVYHYGVTTFLDWINAITWRSEWRKYEVVDATGTAVAQPLRPRTRLGL